jgi:hypothetical protein
MIYLCSYCAALTPEHLLTVGHKQFGWEVVVQGPHPLRFDFAFHGDDDAKERGYEMARQHLMHNGVREIADFANLQWDEYRIGGDGSSSSGIA